MNAHLDNGPTPEPAIDAACIHRWLIGGAVDELAEGTCRRCGLTRQFTNARRAWGSREPVSGILGQPPARPA